MRGHEDAFAWHECEALRSALRREMYGAEQHVTFEDENGHQFVRVVESDLSKFLGQHGDMIMKLLEYYEQGEELEEAVEAFESHVCDHDECEHRGAADELTDEVTDLKEELEQQRDATQSAKDRAEDLRQELERVRETNNRLVQRLMTYEDAQ